MIRNLAIGMAVAVILGIAAALATGCGGGGEAVRRRPRVARVTIPAPSPRARREIEVHSGPMQVAGLTGSLTPYEVREALEARGEELISCFLRQARRLRGLGGRIEIAFHVDGQGRVEWARAIDSTVGHRQVERCVVGVAAQTQFPRPHGGGEADFTWPLELEPPDGVSEPMLWDPSRVSAVVRRRGPRVLEECVDSGSPSIQVTTYVSRSGRVIAAGAVAVREQMDDASLDCVAGMVRRWRMPRATRAAKVTFELRADTRLARR